MSTSTRRSDADGGNVRRGKHFVIMHDIVGPAQLGWTKNRVVLGDEYNDGDANHPERQLSDPQLKRLTDLGAIREASSDEVKAATDARKQAPDDGQAYAGFFVPDPEPDMNIITDARAG